MEGDLELDITDGHQARDQGALSKGSGGDGMTKNLLTDVTAPESPAKKMKKRPPRQSRPTPTKSNHWQAVREKYAL